MPANALMSKLHPVELLAAKKLKEEGRASKVPSPALELLMWEMSGLEFPSPKDEDTLKEHVYQLEGRKLKEIHQGLGVPPPSV